VRELKIVIDRAVVICSGAEIELEDLPLHVQPTYSDESIEGNAELENAAELHQAKNVVLETRTAIRAGVSFRQMVKKFETETILAALQEVDGVQTHAAKLLQMPIRTLVHKMKLLGIKKKMGGYEVRHE